MLAERGDRVVIAPLWRIKGNVKEEKGE